MVARYKIPACAGMTELSMCHWGQTWICLQWLLVNIVLGIVDREFSGRRHQALVLDNVF
jgi:hypothetical protein